METLANLDSFVRSAEQGGFSAAARLLGMTPAAVSRNVAALERNLGVRLFHRSTRRLALTEAGERFLGEVRGHLEGLRSAITNVATDAAEASGVLKLSLAPGFGVEYLLPSLPTLLARHPRLQLDWQFDNRPVDLIAAGFDAAIGGGFALAPGVVSRPLGPAHIVAVASPDYLAARGTPSHPEELAAHEGILMRPASTGRVHYWTLRTTRGEERVARLRERILLNDPAAMTRTALLGLGIALVGVPDALPHLESGRLRRVLSDWYADAGLISLYYATRTQLPPKTRVFVDHVSALAIEQRWQERFQAVAT